MREITSSTSRPLRTVLLVEELGFGGTQRHAVLLAPRLDRAHFDPEVWTLAADLTLGGALASRGIPVRPLTARPVYHVTALVNLARALRRSPPDILVTCTAIPNIWGRLLGRAARIPLIVGNCRDVTPWRQHERWLWRLADHVICNSASVERILIDRYRVPPARVSVIRNGIDLERIDEAGAMAEHAESLLSGLGAPVPAAPPLVVLSVGRLVRSKDYPTLLAAFRQVAARVSDVELWIVGDGPQRRYLAGLADRPSAGRRVRLLGARSDVPRLLRHAALVVSSSRAEGAPNALLEAMAARVPVVATAVGGVPEIVRDGVDGRLVPAGDVTALASAMIDLLEDGDTARRLGASARSRVEQDFTAERMADATCALLVRLARERGLIAEPFAGPPQNLKPPGARPAR